jgi:hypothetical protein
VVIQQVAEMLWQQRAFLAIVIRPGLAPRRRLVAPGPTNDRPNNRDRPGRASPPESPHRSGRADFPHPAPRYMNSLRDVQTAWRIFGRGRGNAPRKSLNRSQGIDLLRDRRSSHFRHSRVTWQEKLSTDGAR